MNIERKPALVRILVVEKGENVTKALKEAFKEDRYEVVLEASCKEALSRITAEAFSLVVLHRTNPNRDLFEILAAARRGLETRVVVLSHRATLEDRIVGLNAGADDYLTKPFALDELTARIRALLRRGPWQNALCFSIGNLSLDLVTRKVTRGGNTIRVSSREFELLRYLMQHRDQVVTRHALAHDVWNDSPPRPLLNNRIDVHIARIRRKIDSGQPKKLIHTVRGLGFMLSEEE